MTVIPVILCGGSGTRLWPESRTSLPKQFLALDGERSLFRATVGRLAGVAGVGRPLILTNAATRFIVADELALDGQPADLVLEPMARDTAPAIAAAAVAVATAAPDAVMVILSSDHHIVGLEGFRACVTTAAKAAAAGRIVVFGIPATTPSTAYGYVAAGAAVAGLDGVFDLLGFAEKTDAATAQRYIAEGRYWNSGMFVARAGTLIDAFEAHAPAVLAAARRAVDAGKRDGDALTLDADAFGSAPKISIDYAVMEKTERAAMVPAAFSWSDVGAWDAVWDMGEKDAAGNVAKGDVLLEGTTNSLIRSERGLAVVLGMADVAVIATQDALLVAPKARSQEIKTIVAKLQAAHRAEVHERPQALRPWGAYETKDRGERYRVKRITVRAGGRLSLQKHMHRSEHWVVVKGVAKVTVDDDVRTLAEKRERLHPAGRGPPSGESRPHPARADRGAGRRLSRGGRHHPSRGRLRPGMTSTPGARRPNAGPIVRSAGASRRRMVGVAGFEPTTPSPPD